MKELDVKEENVKQKQETMFKEEPDQQISLTDLWTRWRNSPGVRFLWFIVLGYQTLKMKLY